ncbi:MAG: hypothetical protein LBH79_03275 [Nitrososphaerota archaeon]|jgi:hypothetical protein|nr:hypothetical protein [Nitrososphaerota archaeon]
MPNNQPTLYTNSPQTFTVNMADIAESAEAYSIPVVFTKEGVHNGALKPYEGFKTQAAELVGKPVVLLHPKSGEANRPVDITRDPVTGEVETCEARDSDKSLHGRIKLDKHKTPKWFIEALKQGQLRGGSPGYWRSAQSAGGLFEGKPYQEIETITGWDHYAIGLVDGAASIQDGVGLRFNSPDNKNDDVEPVTMGKLKQFFSELLKKPKSSEDSNVSETETTKRLEKLEKQLEDLTAQKKDQDKQLEEAKKTQTELEKKLKVYTDQEAKQEQDKKEVLIKEIIEGTDLKAETYKDFTSAQLETVKAQLTAQQKIAPNNPASSQTPSPTGQQQQQADKSAMKPAPTNNPAAPTASTGPYNDQNLTIGNSLFGKKQGET